MVRADPRENAGFIDILGYRYAWLSHQVLELTNEETVKAGKPTQQSSIPSPGNGAGTRRAKIICTIGPSCDTESMMRDLMRQGMDVARLNFSHGTHAEHARNIERLREVARKEHRTICILQDLQGPKIRTGQLKEHKPVVLRTGSKLTITPKDIAGTASLVSTTFKDLAKEVRPGARIL